MATADGTVARAQRPRRRAKRGTKVAMGMVAVVAAIAAATRIAQGGRVARMTTSGTVTSSDGTTIAYTKLGQGPALVLVDGALCYRENGPSADIAPLLARHFTVYAYDRRGRGGSGNTAPYAIAREVEDLAAIIHQAGDSAFVFGMSSGGALALQGAAAGLPVRKLVLYEPPYVERGAGPGMEAMRDTLEQMATAGDRPGAVRYFLREAFGAPHAFVLAMPLLMPRTWGKNKGVAHTLWYDFAILSDRSVLDAHSAAPRIPTLVVGGAKSPDALRDAATRVAKSLPEARAVFLPGRNHDLSAAAPDAVPLMTDFYLSPGAPPA